MPHVQPRTKPKQQSLAIAESKGTTPRHLVEKKQPKEKIKAKKK